MQPPTVDTLEDVLESAREKQTPVDLVLGGRIDAPVSAFVLGRNGQTFDFSVNGVRIRMDVGSVVLRIA
ncbi:MAG: hypothetical protein JNL21_29845 [Myxococcales bacterium]|nr:hypothetical protein [Myxococcales bacterium]